MDYTQKLNKLSKERIELLVQLRDLERIKKSALSIIKITVHGRPEFYEGDKVGLNYNVIQYLISEIEKRIVEIEVKIEKL